jgi:hypothetical protein
MPNSTWELQIGAGMKTSDSPPTLQQVVNDRIKAKGLSRYQLIQQLGYTNISKGIRRMDTYLQTLEAPNDEFIIGLLSALDIGAMTFHKAMMASLSEINTKVQAERKRLFKPHIQLLIDFLPQPWFAAQIIRAHCTISVPKEINHVSFQEELSAVFSLYNERVGRLSFKEKVIGFKYFRSHDCWLAFDGKFICTEISSPHLFPQRPRLLGNKVLDVLINPKNGGDYEKIS